MTHFIDNFPGREILIKGKNYLYFGGTSYLGLQTDEEFQKIFITNVKKYGTNYGASRKSNIRLSVFERAEELLANIIGCESTLTLSSGYLAGQFVAQYFNTPEYRFFYAPNTHGPLIAQPHEAYSSWEGLKNDVAKQLDGNDKQVPVIFLDTIDFQGNNYPYFKNLKELPLNKIIIVADDSHGLGIVGKNGGGAYQELQSLKPWELLVCGSLGKGFGIQAGAVFGTSERIKKLKNTAFFCGASPATPASLATFIDSQYIVKHKRTLLQRNRTYFEQTIENPGYFKSIPLHPTYMFLNEELSFFLETMGFILTNFRYPDENSPIMSRIVLSAYHKKEDIDALVMQINNLYKKKATL